MSVSQQEALEAFCRFFFGGREDALFILKGFAGTGKTTLVAAIVNTLLSFRHKVILLAPTGRAAKVLSGYSGQPAFTIHKKIYRQKSATDGEGVFDIAFNGGTDTLFFVDEASMISNALDEGNFGSGYLLDDLLEFVYNGKNNRLVLLGDVAQLPPVGLEISPALDPDYLQFHYRLEVSAGTLTEVMRQAHESGILYNATRIRSLLGSGRTTPDLRIGGFPDIFRIHGGEFPEAVEECYGRYGEDETTVICRSNKRANRYNEGIRRTILYREEEFSGGDKVMIVKNNYFWGQEYDQIDFIANGDVATVLKVEKRKELYGMHFARARLLISGYGEEVTAWVLLDTLTSDYPALTAAQNREFYLRVEEDYINIPSRKKRFEKIRENEFFNALQLKFAYAVTCHKAQGGQWDAVFIDPGWLGGESPGDDYWRWLYTAVTRARKRLYLVNFPEEFFEK